MSITRQVLAQSLEPEVHDKVLDNNPDRIRNVGERGKPTGATTRTNNKLNPHMTPGIEPGLHWWEASGLTTVQSLLPQRSKLRNGEKRAQTRKANLKGSMYSCSFLPSSQVVYSF